MSTFGDLFQSADWKSEKHVPVIEAPSSGDKGKPITVNVSIGKEVQHPNTTQHHIRWINLYFHPEGSKFPYEIGKAQFSAHGSSTQGGDSSGVYTHHSASFTFMSDKPGLLLASSYCNIHGLWQNSANIDIS